MWKPIFWNKIATNTQSRRHFLRKLTYHESYCPSRVSRQVGDSVGRENKLSEKVEC